MSKYCDEHEDVTDAILTMYTEAGEVKKIKTKTVVLQQTANSLGYAMLCPLMRVPALWLTLSYKGNETSVRQDVFTHN